MVSFSSAMARLQVKSARKCLLNHSPICASWHGNDFCTLALCENNPPVDSLHKGTVAGSVDVLFVVILHKTSNKELTWNTSMGYRHNILSNRKNKSYIKREMRTTHFCWNILLTRLYEAGSKDQENGQEETGWTHAGGGTQRPVMRSTAHGLLTEGLPWLPLWSGGYFKQCHRKSMTMRLH